jgi:hypothetical protein
MRTILALASVLAIAGAAYAQNAQPTPRGTATDITNADIQAINRDGSA